MSNRSKVFRGIAVGLVILALLSGLGLVIVLRVAGNMVSQSVATDPAKLAGVAQRIAEYRVPAGYEEHFAFEMVGFALVELQADQQQGHIYLIRLPRYARAARMAVENSVHDATYRYEEGGLELRPVGERQVTIRGQEVVLTTSEGTNSRQEPYRQIMGVFEGSDGPVLLIAIGPINGWDDEAIDEFITSIR
jgi:hypothetical protein